MEIVRDFKIGNIEVTNSLGINFSNSDSRIKHTGNSNMTIKTVSGKIILDNDTNTDNDSIKINSTLGGITLESAQQLSIQTTDTTDGIKIGTETEVPVVLGVSNNNLTVDSNGLTINSNDQISIQTTDTTDGIKIGTENNVPVNIGNLTFTNNLTLDNDDNDVQYIYLNYNATSTNRWRIYVNDSNGKLTFERYNGSTWISKWSLE